MQAKIKKWGNSQGVIIPKEILKEAGIKLNDLLEIKALKGSITISVPHRRKSLEERMDDYCVRNNITDGFDWSKVGDYGELDLGEPEGREIM